MHAVVYNQLQSDRFQNLIQYAFFKSGYEVVEGPVKLENVTNVCFPRSLLRSFCDEDSENMVFLSCAHCEKNHVFESLSWKGVLPLIWSVLLSRKFLNG